MVDEFLPEAARSRIVVASWYGEDFDGKPMKNGEPFDMYAMTVAHKTLPMGTRVLVQNLCDRREVVAIVTDRGPFVRGRDFDLSKGVAQKLGVAEEGVAAVMVTVLT